MIHNYGKIKGQLKKIFWYVAGILGAIYIQAAEVDSFEHFRASCDVTKGLNTWLVFIRYFIGVNSVWKWETSRSQSGIEQATYIHQ